MSPPLKILQICSADTLGGGERHLLDLVNGLVGYGHELHVAVRPNSPLIDELRKGTQAGSGKIRITTVPLRGAVDIFSARALARLVRRDKIQIVHAHLARDYPVASFAVWRGHKGARLIATRHVLFPLGKSHRLTLSKVGRIMAVSKAVATQVRADAVAPSERVTVVLNGVDTRKFEDARRHFSRERFLASWRLPPDALLIGTVGELTPLKGQEEFLRAAAEVRRDFPRSHFIIAGTDSSTANKHREFLQQLIKDLDLSKHVRMVGWVDDLPQLYCALDVFVSASHTESFGLAIAEAMSSRTAVVATDTEGACEIIQDGKTGLLVRLGDVAAMATSIRNLLRDESERVRLGTAAQKDVAMRFSLERMVEETERIYRAEVEKGLAEL